MKSKPKKYAASPPSKEEIASLSEAELIILEKRRIREAEEAESCPHDAKRIAAEEAERERVAKSVKLGEEHDKRIEAKERARELERAAHDLEEAKVRIVEALSEAEAIVQGCGQYGIIARAEGYWISHIKSALGVSGHSMGSLQDSIHELEGAASAELQE